MRLSFRNVSSYSYKTSPTWFPEYDINKDDINGHTKVNRQALVKPKTYKENYRKLWNAQSRRNNLPKERVNQLIIQYQYSSLKIHVQVILYRVSKMYLYIYEYMCICLHMKNAMNLSERKEEYMVRFRWRRGK